MVDRSLGDGSYSTDVALAEMSMAREPKEDVALSTRQRTHRAIRKTVQDPQGEAFPHWRWTLTIFPFGEEALTSREAAVRSRADPSADHETRNDHRERRRAQAELACERVGIGR